MECQDLGTFRGLLGIGASRQGAVFQNSISIQLTEKVSKRKRGMAGAKGNWAREVSASDVAPYGGHATVQMTGVLFSALA